MPKKAFNKFVLKYGSIGRDGAKGGQFVMPQSVSAVIEKKLESVGSLSNCTKVFKIQMAKELGLPEDAFDSGIVKVMIPMNSDLKLKIPLGNEEGCCYQ